MLFFSGRVYVRNHSNENEFYLRENGMDCIGETLFSYKLFRTETRFETEANVTRKWPFDSD